MKKAILLLILFISAGLAAVDSPAEHYQLDTNHSFIEFAVKHMVISTVKGNFNEFDVNVVYQPGEKIHASVEATIKTASIDTNNESRDEHLKGPDFMEVEKYPEITFKSKKVVEKQSGYELVGDFTMHGVTKEISFPFTISGPIRDPWGKKRVGIEAFTSLNRQEYGVSWSKQLDSGGLVVGDEIKVEINLELVKTESAK